MEDIHIEIAPNAGGAAPGPGDIRLRRIGQGAPIIFSHGAGFACDCFAPLTEILARSHCVYLLDLPGHGVNPALTVEAFSLDLALGWFDAASRAVSARHGGLRPAFVCHSISSVLALRLRAAAPERLSALVAYEPPLAQPDESLDISIADQSVLERRALGRRRTFAAIDELADRFAARDGVGGLSPSAARTLAAGLLRPKGDGFELRCAPEVEAKIYRTNQHFGLWPRLCDPGPPVTILAGLRPGSNDYTADVALQVSQAGAFDLVRLAGLSHLGWAEAPDRAAPWILTALQRVAHSNSI